MLKRTLMAALAAVTLMLGLGLATTPALADVPGLAIGTIRYNPPGPDTPDKRNFESVDVVNVGREPVDVKDLRVEDSWAHANPGRAASTGCNHYTVTGLPGVVPGADGAVMLAPRHTIRVYMGAGTPALDGHTYKLFADSKPQCGYNGGFLNNSAPASGSGPWETVWIIKGGAAESKSYEFWDGYYVR